MVVTCLTVHPRRSLRLGIPARELAFHSSFAKRRDRAAVASACASRTLDAQRGLWSTEGCHRAFADNSANERACTHTHTCFSRVQMLTPW